MVARIGVAVLAVAATVAVGRLVERHVRTSDAFAIKEIALAGNERLDRDAVIEASGLKLGQNVFEVGPVKAKSLLMEHPWIASAEVDRRLPGTIGLQIREHQPAAVLLIDESRDQPSTMYLVSDEAVVFKELEQGDPVDLPVVTGLERKRFSEDRDFRTSRLLEVVALLHDYRGAGLWRREPIGEIHVDRSGAVALYAGDDGTEFRLGRAPFRAKLGRLRRVLDRLEEQEARPAYVYLDNVRRADRATVLLR